MKTVIMYQCEQCEKIYALSREAFLCEAGHFGLTEEEYHKWLDLKKLVKDAVAIEGLMANGQTRHDSEMAINKLLDFEKEHQLKEKI